jgi:hypothetical protein
VGFPVFREGLVHLRIGLEARGLQAVLHHPQPAIRKDRALEGLVGLQSDDHLVVAVDIAGLVRQEVRGRFRIDRKHAFFLFLLEIRLQLGPDGFGALRRRGQELFIAGIRRRIANDEVAHIDAVAPWTGVKASPAPFVFRRLREPGRSFHDVPPFGSTCAGPDETPPFLDDPSANDLPATIGPSAQRPMRLGRRSRQFANRSTGSVAARAAFSIVRKEPAATRRTDHGILLLKDRAAMQTRN